MAIATISEMAPKPPKKPRVFAKVMLLLAGSLAVLALLLGTVGYIDDCNQPIGMIHIVAVPTICRIASETTPVSVLFIPPLIALMVVMAWRKRKRSAG